MDRADPRWKSNPTTVEALVTPDVVVTRLCCASFTAATVIALVAVALPAPIGPRYRIRATDRLVDSCMRVITTTAT